MGAFMKAIKEIAAISVLLCGVVWAQTSARGKFTFIVPESGTIICGDATPIDIIENRDVILPAGGSAISSPAEVVCTIETPYPNWDLQVTPLNRGKIVSPTAGNLKIGGEDAKLAIYVTLVNSSEEGYNPIKVATIGTAYEDATPLSPISKPDLTGTATFMLAAAFAGAEERRFIVDGPTNATLTVKGAPISANSNTRVTSGPGSYIETLEFEIITVF